MGNVQVRLPDALEDALESLAEELHTNRSEALRRALDQGLRSIRLERAVDAYASEEMTLSRAAEYADVSLQQLARALAQRGIARYRYTPSELDRDIQAASEFLERSEDPQEP